MNKKLFYTTLIVSIIVVIGFGYYIFRYSLDPFGAPPKGTAPNCGPEHRYKFDISINSREDFLNFVKNNENNDFKKIFQSYRYIDGRNQLIDRRNNYNWTKIESSITTPNETQKFYYIHVEEFEPYCFNDFKMTKDGHVSIYGCCGD